MRSGGCAVQQELAGDAVAVMRQAVSPALRWGHAQVTPLATGSTPRSLPPVVGGLPPAPVQGVGALLQRRAQPPRDGGGLAPPAMLQFHAHHAGHRSPALSNALAAAFKRALANQRRGGSASATEGQRHIAAKVELEQLVISIVDEPSVGHVMREAGFSSAKVMANVEKAILSSEQSSNMASSSTTSPNTRAHTNNAKESKASAVRVLDCMAVASGTNRCVVVLGESAAAAKWVIKANSQRLDLRSYSYNKGELRRQHEHLKNAQFVPFSAASFQHMPREEVEAWAGDLSCGLLPQEAEVTRQQARGGACEMFYEAIHENPHCVVLVDGVKHNSELEASIMNAMASGTVRGGDGGVVSLEDSIVLCCEVLESRSPKVSSHWHAKKRIMSEVDSKVEDDGAEKGVVVPRLSLDLNVYAIDCLRH
ncbi:unnamed protein product [Miscanthus lutarioriparius]|uniref:Uncharacterized protein n=1 Tax=Miscanthus lutarioriparius TaxID=422564 RepID=A0A811RKP4_9POAL|nr:unnamed protein product [Miscanthus lutarioriparius]